MFEWHLFEAHYGPLGPLRGDYHAAEIALTVANSFRGKRGRRLKLGDFLLKWGERKAVTDADGDSDIDS